MSESSEQPNSLDLHVQAQKLWLEIDVAEAEGSMQLVRSLHRRAGALNARIFEMIPSSKPRTRAIIGNSAVASYFKGGDFESALSLGKSILSDPTLAKQERNLKDISEIVNEIESSANPK